MKVTREETFGPSRRSSASKTKKKAIKLPRHRIRPRLVLLRRDDQPRLARLAEALEYGIVGINTGSSHRSPPFGALKESGMGREGSKYGDRGLLVIKYLCMGGVDR